MREGGSRYTQSAQEVTRTTSIIYMQSRNPICPPGHYPTEVWQLVNLGTRCTVVRCTWTMYL